MENHKVSLDACQRLEHIDSLLHALGMKLYEHLLGYGSYAWVYGRLLERTTKNLSNCNLTLINLG